MCSGIRRAGSLILVLSGFALFTLGLCIFGYFAFRTRLAIARPCVAIRRAGRLILVLSGFARLTRGFFIYGYFARIAY